MRHKLIGLIAFAALSIAGPAVVHAEVATSITAGAVSFQDGTGMYNGTLNISGPNGFNSQSFVERGLPRFILQNAGKLEDGVYTYTLTAATRTRVKVDISVDNGRGDTNRNSAAMPYSTSGTFRVSNGLIVTNASANGASGSDADQAE